MSSWRQIESAIERISNGKAKVISHAEKPWASPTFTGSRHELLLSFEGEEGALIGEAMRLELPNNELVLPGHTVADVAIAWTHHQAKPLRLDFMVRVLVLDESDRKAA